MLGLHATLSVVQGADAARQRLHALTARLRTRLWFDDTLAADVTGAHTAPDLWRLIAWLARHAQARGRPLRAGDLITTGSCTPPVFAAEGARVTGEIDGLGRLELTL